LNTGGPVAFVFDQLMHKNTGTYQISFQNINCEKLEDVEIGVLSITNKYKEGDILNRKYGVNFAGHPLEFKQFFVKRSDQLSQIEKQSDQYKHYNKFIYHHRIFQTFKNSILTMQLNTKDGTMIFFINSKPIEYICDVKMSDFPCKFFVFNVGVTSVRMTRFKHDNRYFDNIEQGAAAIVYKWVYEDDDDEEPEVDKDLTEFAPRIVSWEAELL
jgi:hypothetical protein